MDDKKLFIELYFKDWKESFSKVKTLLKQNDYYLEAILLLSCYIDAFAALHYSTIQSDGEKYKKVVLEYSGMKEMYELIDLLFFYQWPRSDFKANGEYKKLKHHHKLVRILKTKYGDEAEIKEGTRYISQDEFISHISSNSFADFDQQNLKQYLPLFSLCETLYRYLRCYAVHNVSFPFINKGQMVDGKIIYQCNHKITGDVLLQTSENILNNLESECIKLIKWPNEL